MKKLTLLAILLTGGLLTSYAQPEPTNSPEEKKEKKFDHYVGVQLNGLIRQVFNFSNSNTSTIVNPYLLTYNINLRKSGWGIRTGVGYNYASNYSNDNITEATTNINDLQLRLGIEKAFRLSEKWTAGVGVDGLMNMNDDKTVATVRSFDTTTTTTKSNLSSYGGGAMGWLRYNITKNITIGTEASLYYVTGKQDNNTLVVRKTRSSSGGGSTIITTETKSKPTISQASIRLPIVFYIALRF